MLLVTEILQLSRGCGSPDQSARASKHRFGEVGAPAVAVWNCVSHCNMTCPHCYAAAVGRPSPDDLTTEQATAMIDALADGGVKVLIASGGEPLLRRDLFMLLEHARDRGLSTHLSSNGVLLRPAIAEHLARVGVQYVGISIDGTPDWNDAWRGMRDGHRLAVEGLRAARGAGMRTGLRCTLTRKNADMLGELLNLARGLPVDRFYVSHLIYSGRASMITGDDLSPPESRALLHALFELAAALVEAGDPLAVVTGGNDAGGPLLVRWVAERYGADAASQALRLLLRRGGNSAGERMICVDAQGLVYPDQFWRTAPVGDLRTDTLATVLAHPLLAQLRRRDTLLEGRCADCAWKPACRGSHRERAIASGLGTWGPDPACVLRDDELHHTLPPDDRHIGVTP